MRFKFGTGFTDGSWFIGEHCYDVNGHHYLRPLVTGFKSQVAAYWVYADLLMLEPACLKIII